jgi:alanyl-tRNA synthetase
LVSPELLRFDFNHFQALTPTELAKVEEYVNEQIWQAHPVEIREMSKDQAIAAGAIAFFGEKYGDTVRVIKAGAKSVELCGGTHVKDTAEIQMFRIVSESAIASGVRRIVAYTSQRAFEYLRERDLETRSVRELLKATTGSEVEDRIHRLMESEKHLRRELAQYEAQKLEMEVRDYLKSAVMMGATPVVLREVKADERGMKLVRDMVESVRSINPSAVAVIAMNDPASGKVYVAAGLGAQAPKSLKANELITQLMPIIDGKGGGKPDMAQAGGSKVGAAEAALAAAKSFLQARLG